MIPSNDACSAQTPTRNEAAAVAKGDPRLLKVAEQYLASLEAGRTPNQREILEQHPDLKDEIATCLGALDFIHRATADVRQHSTAARTEKVLAPSANAETFGDFRIVRELGRGGMGVVYEAEQLSMGRKVALKMLPFAGMADDKALQRFRNEVRAVGTLDHPNIVSVYAVGEERGIHYFAMQLIRGQRMSAVIRELQSLQPDDTPLSSRSRTRDCPSRY